MGVFQMEKNISNGLAALTAAAFLTLSPAGAYSQQTQTQEDASQEITLEKYSQTEYLNHQEWDTGLILKDAPVNYLEPNDDIESVIEETGKPGVYLYLHKNTVESKNVAKIFADIYSQNNISSDEYQLYVVQFDSELMDSGYMVISEVEHQVLLDNNLTDATFPVWEVYDIEDGDVVREWRHTYGGPATRETTNEYAPLVTDILENRLFD